MSFVFITRELPLLRSSWWDCLFKKVLVGVISLKRLFYIEKHIYFQYRKPSTISTKTMLVFITKKYILNKPNNLSVTQHLQSQALTANDFLYNTLIPLKRIAFMSPSLLTTPCFCKSYFNRLQITFKFTLSHH